MTSVGDGFHNVPCLVLGGGGFIGKSLTDALLRQGAAVRGFGRVSQGIPIDPRVSWVHGDFNDTASVARAVEGADIVFHLLGSSTPESSNMNPVSDLVASVGATVQLLEICVAAGVRRLVFGSSGGTVYGVPSRVPIVETAPTDPISAYGVNKLTIEKYLSLYRRLRGLDYIALRIANPFGPYQNPRRRQGVVAALLYRLITGQALEIWGDGRVIRDFIFINDVVEALLATVHYDGTDRLFNVGSGVGRSINEVADDAIRVLALTGVKRVYKSARAADVPVNVLDISLASRELGWKPQSDWLESLRITADWIRSCVP